MKSEAHIEELLVEMKAKADELVCRAKDWIEGRIEIHELDHPDTQDESLSD